MKVIIEIDKIPNNCRNIRGDAENGRPFGGMICRISEKDVMYHVVNGTKPDCCPLKEIPEQLEELKQPYYSMNDYQKKGFARGWNSCLEMIMKG